MTITRAIPLCASCTRMMHRMTGQAAGQQICDAFPKGIPEDILVDGFDHRQSYPGDSGVLYDPDPEKDFERTMYDKQLLEGFFRPAVIPDLVNPEPMDPESYALRMKAQEGAVWHASDGTEIADYRPGGR